jgi:integrase
MKYPKTRIEKYDGGCLRIRWGYGKNLRGFSLGLRDSVPGLSEAKLIQAQINHDFETGKQDPLSRDYSRYQQTKGREEKPESITAPELFAQFAAYRFKAKGLKQASIDTRYTPLQRALEKHLDLPISEIGISEAEQFADRCAVTLATAGTAKARIFLLTSCWAWTMGKHGITDNPWVGIGDRFRSMPQVKNKQAIFSAEEVQSIIAGFRASRYYAHYADFVEVAMFGLGLRPGEGMALRWDSISQDFKNVTISRSITNGVSSETTKTKTDRTLNIPPSIAEVLKRRKEEVKPKKKSELIFTTPNGLPIHTRNFRNRAWKGVLTELGIDYRRPHKARGSAESFAVASNPANIAGIAKAFGHKTETLYEHYLDSINNKSVFVEFADIESIPPS